VTVSDATHPSTDVFNSTVSTGGVYGPDAAQNTLGFDASLVDLPGPLDGADRSIAMEIVAQNDAIRLGVVTFALDL